MFNIKKLFFATVVGFFLTVPGMAYADGIIDSLNLAPFVPLVLDALMMVATGTYEFFVESGVIMALIIGFLAMTVCWYVLKLFIPHEFLTMFNIKPGDKLGEVKPQEIAKKILQPGLRAVVALAILLPLKPEFMTKWLINPFLQLGSVYTTQVIESTNLIGTARADVSCPEDIIEQGWLNKESCKFLVQPIAEISATNNQIIRRGFTFLSQGLLGMMTLIPHGGEDILNVITGIVLILTFISSNLFMAMLIIQGIFDFGVQLMLYPFYVLTYVTKSSKKWFDIWPAFSGITQALQRLIITMIACAFILCINIAVVKALFKWNTSVFVMAAGGSASANIAALPVTDSFGFGEHSVTWLSAILTFFLLAKIFEMTQQQLQNYIGKDSDKLYKQASSDVKVWWGRANKAIGWLKK